MGKSTISMAMFNSKLLNYQRVLLFVIIPPSPYFYGSTFLLKPGLYPSWAVIWKLLGLKACWDWTSSLKELNTLKRQQLTQPQKSPNVILCRTMYMLAHLDVFGCHLNVLKVGGSPWNPESWWQILLEAWQLEFASGVSPKLLLHPWITVQKPWDNPIIVEVCWVLIDGVPKGTLKLWSSTKVSSKTLNQTSTKCHLYLNASVHIHIIYLYYIVYYVCIYIMYHIVYVYIYIFSVYIILYIYCIYYSIFYIYICVYYI